MAILRPTAQSLGQQLRNAMAGSVEQAPVSHPPPAWPYAIARSGAGVLAVAALLLLYIEVCHPDQIAAGPLGFAIAMSNAGAFLLGVAAIGMGWYGHGGVGQILGSLAIPVAFAIGWLTPDTLAHTHALVVVGAFCVFAIGHVIAPGVSAAVRLTAGQFVIAGALELASLGHPALFSHGGHHALAVGFLASLAAVGWVLAVAPPQPRREVRTRY